MPFDIEIFADCHVLVIGDVMLDRYVWGDVSRISPEAPVPVVLVKEKAEVLGGAGNVAANVAGLGCTVSLIGICGNDTNGKQLKQLVKNKGINEYLFMDHVFKTISKVRVMAQDQQLIRLDEEEVASPSPDIQEQIFSTVKETLPQVNAVILSDYNKGFSHSHGLCQRIIKLCSEFKVPVIVDPKGKKWDKYCGATCITPNSAEFDDVVGDSFCQENELIDAATSLRERFNLDWLLVTRGSHGMSLISRDNSVVKIHAKAREVYDVSGAGDTVVATLASAVGAGMSFPDAAVLANTAASIVVGKLGTQPVNKEELQVALKVEDNEGQLFNSKFKTVSLATALLQLKSWRSSGEKIVFTNGCFDLLHPGHINLLHEARALGDRLIIGLNADVSIKELKGDNRPILSEQDRAAILSALECVDLVILFSEETPLHLITNIQPDILVKGADYQIREVVGRDVVESYGGVVKLVSLTAGYSTTNIEKKIGDSLR